MSRDYFILNQSRVIYSPGHYDRETACDLAKQWAQREPGKTFRVVQIVETYKVEKARKTK